MDVNLVDLFGIYTEINANLFSIEHKFNCIFCYKSMLSAYLEELLIHYDDMLKCFGAENAT